LKESLKLLGPERRRAAVHHLIATMKVSERFAGRVTGQNRTTQRREPVRTGPHSDAHRGVRRLSTTLENWTVATLEK
jgi:hypothetical protein